MSQVAGMEGWGTMKTPHLKVNGVNVNAVDPWFASGPGWSNAGITVHLEDDNPITIYQKDMRGDLAVLFEHAANIMNDIKKSVAKHLKGEIIDL